MSDERGRVPLALVGVALLVASVGVAGHLSLAAPRASVPQSDRAAGEATALARLAVSHAAVTASRAAARHPVVVSSGPYGRALRPGHAFRDALRLRVYLAARRALRNATGHAGSVTVTPSLSGIESPADARRAIRRVRLARRPNGGMNVTVANVTLTLRRGERLVDRDNVTLTVGAATPVLGLHERVRDYATRLGNGPLDGPGLGRRLTGRLTVVALGRGWAQYGGAPIANVIATRHVAVTANAAVLGVQRETLGRTDPNAIATYRRRAVATGVQDLLAASSNRGPYWSPGPAPHAGDAAVSRLPSVRIGVNATADRAYLAVTNATLDRVLQRTYRGRIAVRTAVRRVSTHRTNDAASNVSRRTIDVTPASTGPSPRTPVGFTRLATRYRRVRVTARRGNETVETTYRVGVETAGRVAPAGDAPGRPLAAAPTVLLRHAGERAVDRRGGVDALARRAVHGDVTDRSTTVSLPVPTRVRERALVSLTRLRRRLEANLSTRVPASRVLDGDPRRRLGRRLAHRSDRYVDAPTQYPTLGARAVTAARTAYVGMLVRRLRGRASGFAAARKALAEDSPVSLTAASARPSGHATASSGRGNLTVLAVRGAPAYLSVDRGASGRYPLATRDVNLFTVPYDDAGAAVAKAVVPSPPERASLASAVATLHALRGVRGNASVRRRRGRLRDAVREATRRLRTPLRKRLAGETALTPSERREAVSAAFASYPNATATAAAAVSGSLADRVATEATRRGATGNHGRLRVSLRLSLRRARRARARVSKPRVAEARQSARRVLGTVAAGLARRGGDAAKRELLRAELADLPSGLPVAPVPGYWAVTVNAWTVSVRGGYRRFAVTARSREPGNDSLTYVRRNATVRFDVDGDGRPERVGRNRAVRFSVTTLVVVAVPPGPRGVGDTGGPADERSAGW